MTVLRVMSGCQWDFRSDTFVISPTDLIQYYVILPNHECPLPETNLVLIYLVVLKFRGKRWFEIRRYTNFARWWRSSERSLLQISPRRLRRRVDPGLIKWRHRQKRNRLKLFLGLLDQIGFGGRELQTNGRVEVVGGPL